MRRRTTLEVALALMLTIGLVASCGGAEPGGQPGAGESSESATLDEPAGDGEGLGKKLEALLAGVRPPRSYEVNSEGPDGQPPMTMLVKMGEDRSPQKVKMIMDDGWMLVDMVGGSTYAYEPSENVVMKMPIGAGGAEGGTSPGDYVDPGATTIASESVDGVRCWVIESQVGPMKSRVWVGAGDGLPRQFETDEGITRFVYSRVNQVSDDEFDLPAGVDVVDMAKMMQRGFEQGG